MAVETTTLGTAARDVSVRTYHVLDGTAYFVATNLQPPAIGAFDLDRRTVVERRDLPTGSGAWAMTALGDDLYVGTSDETTLCRYRTATGEIERVASIPDERVICDADAHGSSVFLGTYPSAHLYEYDVDTGELTDHGRQLDEQYVRNVWVTADTVYAGTAATAHLFAIDRETGERADVLPESAAGESSTRTMWGTDSHVVLLTRPSGKFVVVDRATHDVRVRMPPDADGVSNVLVRDGDVHVAAALPDDADDEGGVLYRYDPAGDAFDRVGRLPAPSLDQGLFPWGESVVGCESGGRVWTSDPAAGTSTVTALGDAGLPPGPMVPRALCVYDGDPVVATPGKLHRHEDGAVRQVRTPRSTKALTQAGDTLYAAKYVDAILAAYEGEGEADEATDLFELGHEQNRPRVLHHHEPTDLVFVGTVPEYGHLGGALSYFERGTTDPTVRRNVIPDQSVCALASTPETVFVGSEIHGEKVDPVAEEARVAAWDPRAEATRWELTPVAGAEAVTDLAVCAGRAWGTASDGSLFALDPDAREVVERVPVADADAFSPRPRQLVALDGTLYLTTPETLSAVDPATGEATPLLDDHDPVVPELAADSERGLLYALAGWDLLRVRPE